MSLQEVSIKNEYRSLIDNVVQEFYIPLLERAKVYKRAVGFFSSSSESDELELELELLDFFSFFYTKCIEHIH